MIIVYIFLVLAWLAMVAVVLFGGGYLTIRFGQDADSEDLSLKQVALGLFTRGFGTLALTAIIAGAPFQLGVF